MSLAVECRLLNQAVDFGLEVQITGEHRWEDIEEMRLVDLARSGEIRAFEELVRRHRNTVFALAYHFVRNREDAWDIAQEVFVKAYRSLKRFRGDSSFKTWLMRITSNQCKDHLKAARLKTVSLEVAPAGEDGGGDRSPRQQAEAEELGVAIQQAIETIPFNHRHAFILREFERLSYKEIAKVMGCSIGTVMSRLHHARRKIRDALVRKGVSLE